MVKVTFSLDDDTVREIRRTAERLGTAQSQVVREAVAEYAARADRVSERERLRTLAVLEGLKLEGLKKNGAPSRSGPAVDAELRELRAARRKGGRRTPQ